MFVRPSYQILDFFLSLHSFNCDWELKQLLSGYEQILKEVCWIPHFQILSSKIILETPIAILEDKQLAKVCLHPFKVM